MTSRALRWLQAVAWVAFTALAGYALMRGRGLL